jgi:hypothetical protein
MLTDLDRPPSCLRRRRPRGAGQTRAVPRPLLAVLAAVVFLAACGGGAGGGDTPLSLQNRLLRAGDLDDLAPATIPRLQATFNAGNEFGPWPVLVPGSAAGAGPLLAEAGMVAGRWAPLDVSPPRYAYSLVGQFDSDQEAARRVGIVRDNLTAASGSVHDFSVDIPGAKAAAGTANGVTSQVVAFSDGPFVYVVATSSPGGFTDEQVAAAAEKLYERVQGKPPPS